MLWQEQVIGWANVGVRGGRVESEFGYIDGKPKGIAFRNALEDEIQRMTAFLA